MDWSLIPSPSYVKWSNSWCLLRLFLSHLEHLSLSFILPYLLCITLIIRSCFLIPDIFHFGSLLWHPFHSSLDVSLTNFQFFTEPLSQFFGSFSLGSRWNFHWLKPDVDCTSVSTWPSPAQEDESLAALFYQSTLFPHPSLTLPADDSKIKWAPDWLCVGLGDNKVVNFFIF